MKVRKVFMVRRESDRHWLHFAEERFTPEVELARFYNTFAEAFIVANVESLMHGHMKVFSIEIEELEGKE